MKGRLLAAAACALTIGLWAGDSYAQMTPRGKPVVRTPRKNGAPAAAPDPGKAPDPGQKPDPTDPKASPGAPANPNDPKAKKDPLSQLATPTDIEYRPPPPGQKYKFNLDDTDLPTLVKAVSQITGRRFIYGSKLHAIKVTVYSPEEIGAGEAYAAFLSAAFSRSSSRRTRRGRPRRCSAPQHRCRQKIATSLASTG
jgi:general secretion pathway protein D